MNSSQQKIKVDTHYSFGELVDWFKNNATDIRSRVFPKALGDTGTISFVWGKECRVIEYYPAQTGRSAYFILSPWGQAEAIVAAYQEQNNKEAK